MSLKKQIAARIAEEPVVIRSVDRPSKFIARVQATGAHLSPEYALKPMVIVSIWQGKSWILPWARFEGARVESGAQGQETLVMSFSDCQVKATGTNLLEVLDDIGASRVRSMRSLPPEYRAQLEPGEPFITHIEVQP